MTLKRRIERLEADIASATCPDAWHRRHEGQMCMLLQDRKTGITPTAPTCPTCGQPPAYTLEITCRQQDEADERIADWRRRMDAQP